MARNLKFHSNPGLIKIRQWLSLLLIVGSGVNFLSCENNDSGAGYTLIPERYISREINIKQPEYSDLNHPGGFVYLNEGYRGVVVVYTNEYEYKAFERACPFKPDKSCATISMHRSRLYMACGEYVDSQWKACIPSKYNLDGSVLEGPSDQPLKSYNISKNGSVLRITNSTP